MWRQVVTKIVTFDLIYMSIMSNVVVVVDDDDINKDLMVEIHIEF
jgi:hypothetical protein